MKNRSNGSLFMAIAVIIIDKLITLAGIAFIGWLIISFFEVVIYNTDIGYVYNSWNAWLLFLSLLK